MFLEKYSKLKSDVSDDGQDFRVYVEDDELDNGLVMWLDGSLYSQEEIGDEISDNAYNIMTDNNISKIIFVDIVDFDDGVFFRLPKNRQDSCATVLFKRFIKYYRENFKNIPVIANFYNYDLQEKFKDACEKGIFPAISTELSGYTELEEWQDEQTYNKANREKNWKMETGIVESLAGKNINVDILEQSIQDTPFSQTMAALNSSIQELELTSDVSIRDIIHARIYNDSIYYDVPLDSIYPNFRYSHDFAYKINNDSIEIDSQDESIIERIKSNKEKIRNTFDNVNIIEFNNKTYSFDEFFSDRELQSKVKRLRSNRRS